MEIVNNYYAGKRDHPVSVATRLSRKGKLKKWPELQTRLSNKWKIGLGGTIRRLEVLI